MNINVKPSTSTDSTGTPSTPLSFASKPRRRKSNRKKTSGRVTPTDNRRSGMFISPAQSVPTPTTTPLNEKVEKEVITIRSPKRKRSTKPFIPEPLHMEFDTQIPSSRSLELESIPSKDDSPNDQKPKASSPSYDDEHTLLRSSSARNISFADVKNQRRSYFKQHKEERNKLHKTYIESIKLKYETLKGWEQRIQYAERLSFVKSFWSLLIITSMIALTGASLAMVIYFHDSIINYSCSISPYLYTALAIVILELSFILPVCAYGFFNLTYATQGGFPTYLVLNPVGNWCTLFITAIQLFTLAVEGTLSVIYCLLYVYAYDCFPPVLSLQFYFITSYFLLIALVCGCRAIFFILYLLLSISPCVMPKKPPSKKRKKPVGHHPDRVRSVLVSK
mmetsp:Transcript_2934/g.4270  ORF Transcript_2934/g.4270 Transcript_2934/m.4270 type:complete len:392 (-) Transcript_2934:542-1717(-)